MTVKRVSATLARTQELPYTTFLNGTIELIKNPDALAIYVYLQTKNEHWIVRREDVMKRFEIGKHRYTEAMKHLRELGLVERKVTRCEKGQVTDNQLIIHYAPNALSSGLRTIGNPDDQESSSLGHLETDQSFRNESIDNNTPPNGSASGDAGVQELELNEPLNTDQLRLKESGSSDADKPIRKTKAQTLLELIRSKPELLVCFNCVDDELLLEWCQVREKNNGSRSDRALSKIDRALDELRTKHGIAPEKAVEVACDKVWRSIEVEWVVNVLKPKGWPNASYQTNQNNTKVDVDAAMAPRAVRRQESTPEQLKRNQEQAANLLNMFKGG